jgi:hypothetical protein
VDGLHVRLRTILIGPTTRGRSRETISIPNGALTATLHLERDTEGPVITVAGVFPGSAEEAESVGQAALGELRDATMLVIELVRWRLDPDSWAGDSIRGGGSFLEWSADGSEWTLLGDTTEREVMLVPSSAELSEEAEQALAAIADSGAREPLGREIWHTALGSHTSRQYRTAIVLAVNAVEVGLKQFIASVVPKSEWFVMNAQSPPIYKILKEYLPELPGVDKDNLPDKETRSILHAAVQRRNKMIHVGVDSSSEKALPDKEESIKVLGAASDLLWLLDYYSGHEWALGRIGWAKRQSLDWLFGR